MSSRNNPISLRIYKAIGTNFDDPGSREALEIVSTFYAPTVSANHKGKEKAGPLQNGDAEESDVFGTLRDDEEDGDMIPKRRTLKGQSAAMARKYLKRDIERKLAEGSQKFLHAFGEVDQVSAGPQRPFRQQSTDAAPETQRAARAYAGDADPV